MVMQHEVAKYEAYAVDHPVCAPVRGRVRAVAAFGVFVELAPNVQGLLKPLTSLRVPVRFPDDYPQIGTSMEAIIKFFDVPMMNIRLTQRPAAAA
jgi:ribosomal protein S1